MDEVFWANVVKRWSDASENVIILKKELAKVKEERDLFRGSVQTRRSDHEVQHQENAHRDHGHPPPVIDHDDSTIQDELQDAEVGLVRAKEEYRRLQQELAVSLEMVKTLKTENESIMATHRQEVARLTEELARSNGQLKKDAFERGLLPNPPEREESSGSKERFAAFVLLKERVQILEQAIKDGEENNQHLRDELAVTKDKLHKAEESSKALLGTIVKLQGIARHSSTTGMLRSISNSLLNSDFRGPSRKPSYASTHHPQERDKDQEHPISSFSNTVSIDNIFAPYPHSSLPPQRQSIVAALPSGYIYPVDTSENLFDRNFLKAALANGMQSLASLLPDDSPNKTSDIYSHLCPTLNHHPWCPSSIGQHGFIFVGLGKEKDAYRSPVTRNLFVGLPKDHSRTRAFRYLGVYKVSRTDPLSLDEWDTLSDNVKVMYSNLTKEKTHDARLVDEILSDYNEGRLVAPCVKLQFMRFDADFYGSLMALRKTMS